MSLTFSNVFCFLTLQASVSSGSSKDTNSHKDDGLFKAPPPPPKVIKSVTIPTQPYQDIVTALKCRKEHKEVSQACWVPRHSLKTVGMIFALLTSPLRLSAIFTICVCVLV